MIFNTLQYPMLNATPVETKTLDLKILKKFVLSVYLLLFPLFFLPFIQDAFSTNKFFLTVFTALLLLLISTVEFLAERKVKIFAFSLEEALSFLVAASLFSLVITSPNKTQALLSYNFGPVALLAFAIIFYYLIVLELNPLPYLSISAVILSLLTIVIFHLNPFSKISLPPTLNFLKNPYFTPIGSYLDLLIFLGFTTALLAIKSFYERKKIKIIDFALFFVISLGFLAALYHVIKPKPVNGNPFKILLPPLSLSWYAAVETLKQPLTALFGAGIDNYASYFTKVRNVAFNQSDLWQITFFNFGRNVILHIFTVAGLLGVISIILFLFKLAKEAKKNSFEFYTVVLLGFLFLISPPSIIVWFLFFTSSVLVVKSKKLLNFDFSEFMPGYIGILAASILFTASAGYLISRAYAAEIYFKKALDALSENNGNEVYSNMRQAIRLNPYIERFRINFSQVNLLIANSLTQQILEEQNKEKPDQEKINQLRTSVSQAIQAAINEAKAAVALNSQKASNWANLAAVYRNILNVAQNADVWTVSSYQRAIVLDPQNPIYRLDLGGTYYSLLNYNEALKLFEQAVALKPDWANAHYNLAWAAYNLKDYQRAVSEMQNVLNLLDPKKNKGDYEKAKKELEQFKKTLEESGQATGSAITPTPTPTPSQLRLPTPAPTLGEKISLPKEASPEARQKN